MNKSALFAVAIATTAHAEPPLETYLPTQPSGEQKVIFNINGVKHAGMILNFGVQDVQAARNLGRELFHEGLPPSETEKILESKAAGRYHDPYFERCFFQEAVVGFSEERNLSVKLSR
jgi:hypothetical protein